MNSELFPDLMTTEEAAKILKMHLSTITRLIKSNKIRATRYFGEWRIDAQHLRSTLKEQLKKSETIEWNS